MGSGHGGPHNTEYGGIAVFNWLYLTPITGRSLTVTKGCFLDNVFQMKRVLPKRSSITRLIPVSEVRTRNGVKRLQAVVVD